MDEEVVERVYELAGLGEDLSADPKHTGVWIVVNMVRGEAEHELGYVDLPHRDDVSPYPIPNLGR